ncbi:16S rRNA (cytosine(967)-C(5))-methyltransferase RsmB [Thermoflexus sp.]|uniref:16S rRNA (cytosine(967)-C(5))-methyltransferase RsmB n=1 Tax=Thermoflexus sp. TaxID=1969742 RepID=UPI0025E52039|nr:16S rRNA (cytosine(967)-C(5))-methyltransferase RsmB [Thermoflexus sp.]MCS6964865.1 16S rRNA (cytosine(967)-C(5))-methyltransferase RsmB [Thermoflexus sp.]MCX7690059.1 16S rRNA (cytosine(967)-C(5))-methyltransferase RsmB [Thermoflexus sp.]MDW8064518.1 16S rRNA (cytosine(967)-C(5))-methyltransferase RsmB [Anaerolineae bacterium]
MPTRPSVRSPARYYALKALHRIETRAAYADYVLQGLRREVDLSPRDQDLLTTLVDGVTIWRKTLDWVLARYVRGGLDRLDPWARNALRMGLYQLMFLDRIPRWAAVHETVEVARALAGEGVAALVNAVLRRISDRLERGRPIATFPSIEEDPVAHLAVRYSFPEWMVRRWIARYGVEGTRELCRFHNAPRPLSLRVNRLRASREEILADLEARGGRARPGAYHPYIVLVEGGLDLTAWSAYQEGKVIAQDEAAALVPYLMDLRPGLRVLDLCAAPGGKTTAIAEGMGDRGIIVAADAHFGRLRRLREHALRMGFAIIRVVQADGQRPFLPEWADRILIDAPCLGTGVLARRSDARWHKQESDLASLVQIQRALLEAAARMLRPGGRLVYSTCSLEPEENEGQIEAFLRDHPEFRRVSAQGKVPSPFVDADGYYRVLPHIHQMDGAFGAILEKAEG